ncbi:MAG TPA: hypothetical protein VJJ52_01060 [Candidatus Nanoarchaeia archaeon]|nr:hypothetical protein [Candidatus Nanoarchaeia archaeon]
MKPVYVLVHASPILELEGNFGGRLREVYDELHSIIRQEEYIPVENPLKIPDGLQRNREIKVCGGLRDVCVSNQLETLVVAGFNTTIHEAATLP